MQSDSINELASALAKAQAEIKGAKTDSENPFFKSKYADLASVWEACRAPLTKHGLCVIQTTESEGGQVYIMTTLAHSSGQWISGRLQLFPKAYDSQSIGSAISYSRRYALSALVGIYQEDDDGEAAMHRSDRSVNSQHPSANPAIEASCKTCGAKLIKSSKKPIYFCPNFKDKTAGEHPAVPESELDSYIKSQSPLFEDIKF